WHVSLSSFVRDYVYVPLGGARGSLAVQARTLLVTWCLMGLWHGAAWHYVAWGAYHGVLVTAHRALAGAWRGRGAVPAPLAWAPTFVLMNLGWLLFRAPSLAALGGYFGHAAWAGSAHDVQTATLVAAL